MDEKNPQDNRKELKLARARYYYWIYFNDRKWFDVMLPLVCVKYSVRRVNWDERDIALARKIEMLSDKLNMVISLPCLDAAVNAKGAIIRYKDKAPRTMNVISQRFKLK